MHLFFQRAQRGLLVLLLGLLYTSVIAVTTASAQQATGALRGQVADEFGGTIIGATVTATDTATGTQKTATTNDQGLYAFAGLTPGTYTVSATATGFAPFENASVEVAPGRRDPLNIKMSVSLANEEVTVAAESPVSTAPENNAGAVVLREADIQALPEDPDDLAAALQALAGPSAGPNGGQIYIDGFTGGRLPPRETIREIRINQNPFSAEYDRPGHGRIEILTKPGTEKFRGQAFINFQDESLNSRNPYTANRAPYQQRQFGGNFSGPIIKKKASFFLDFEKRDIDDNSNINAQILDPSLNIVTFPLAVLTPRRRTTFSPRFDYQINNSNTFVARYTYAKSSTENAGLTPFSLPSRAYNTANNEHTLQLTETAVLSPRLINETRFQFVRERSDTIGDNSLVAINVLDAFFGGGAQVGVAFNNENRFELQNYATWTPGNHTIKFGGRLRAVKIADSSQNNFGGTYTFAGGQAPELDANNQVVLGADGQPNIVPIFSIERYRRTLLFQNQGLTPAQIRALGGGASQFSIAGGDPLADVSQTDFGGFAQDDWKIRPNLTLSGGLRYETQNNINSHLNFAPRLSFAWSPLTKAGSGGGNASGGIPGFGQQQSLVIRGGFGVFYDRFSENYTLQARRFNGINQQQYTVSAGTPDGLNILNSFPNVPSLDTLNSFALPQTTRVVASTLEAPYQMQGVLSIEKLLPHNITVFSTFISGRTLHALRLRNINAPLPGTYNPTVPGSGVRPLGPVGDILQYESSGRINQNQLIIGERSRLNQYISINAFYTLNKVRGDTDGGATAPSDPYNLNLDYGRTSFDIRHRFFLFGNFTLPWALQLSPFIIASSSAPFNIVTGRDSNGDTFFNERPAFASDPNRDGVVLTRFGALDPNPIAGEQIVPRYYGNGPKFFVVNLSVSKTIGFGSALDAGAGNGGGGRRGGGGGRRGGGGFGEPFGGGGFGGGSSSDSRYNLTFTVRANDIFNRNNAAIPTGNISSPLFDIPNESAGGFGRGGSAAGNRRIELQMRFSF